MATKQYIGASTPWHEDEVSRRRRVAEANRAAYDEARVAERGVRGGSVFSYTPRESVGAPDGIVGTASNTVVGPQTGNMPIRSEWDVLDSQARIGSEFADLARRSAAVRQHNARIGVDSISAAMRSARSNGGRLPQNAVDMLSRNLGLDGRTSAVYGAGYLGNGDFDIDIVTRGANGGLQRTTKKITPLEQYNMMLASPGIWGEDGVAASQELYNRLRNTMGKSELPPQGVYAENLRAYNTKKQSADTMKMMTGLYQAVYKDMSKGGKQPVTTDVIRARMASDLLKDKNIGPQITSVPDLNEDGTQKMVEDENGQQVPAMRQADPNNPDDVERVKQNLKMRLDLVPELAPRQDAQGGGEADRRLAFLKYIYDRENPQTPPDVLAFQQRQRERQMRQVEEAQAREDVTRRPQQLINYFKDGKWHSGNGYVRDGKVYDGQGYEIEGATPAEMARGNDGGVVSNERGWFARALPSARELVGGGAGGGNASEGAAQGTQQPAQGEGGVNWTPGHDLRNDGKTLKGTGWLGVLRLPNGGVASEYTIGVNIDGKEIDIPTLVPTLTKEEQDLMVNDVIPNNKDVPDSIVKKAVDFAKMRLANGRSVFANDGTPQGGQTQPAATQPTAVQQGAEATTAQGWRPKTPDEIAKVKAEIASRKAKIGEGEKTNEQLEREAMEREESLFSQIRQNGGRLFNDENGHRYIDVGGGFGKLPNDSPLRSKLDKNGYYDIDAEGHSIEDAVKLQGEVLKVVQELAKKKDDFNRRRAAAAAAFHRDAFKAHPNDSKRRQDQERRMMEGWLKDNDPDYEKKRSRVARERAQQRFNSDDLLGSEVLSSDIQ